MDGARETGRGRPADARRRRNTGAAKLVAANARITLPDVAPPPPVVSSALVPWFREHRRPFTWRSTDDPYRVLVAEILLRKTGAAAVEGFLPRFFAAYPSPRELAATRPRDLATLLGPIGLGLQRGQQLHELGQRLVSEFGGAVPSRLDELLSLPGVGPYTAAMVAATCFGEPVSAVDTNVARVLCRVFGVAPTHFEARRSPNVWQSARALLEVWPGPSAALSWVLLDLGSLVCTARRPSCSICPLQTCCAFARGKEAERNPSV